MSKIKKILLIGLAIIASIFFLNQYKKYRFENYKEIVISNLEKYKANHSNYPERLDELKIDLDEELLYYPDSLKQNYTLGYSTGILEVNSIIYNSKTKRWEEKFNF